MAVRWNWMYYALFLSLGHGVMKEHTFLSNYKIAKKSLLLSLYLISIYW